ncbi:hypothetical protein LguiB_032740 [Lonicera macranthoides]
MEHDDTLKNVLSKSSLVLYLQGSAVERRYPEKRGWGILFRIVLNVGYINAEINLFCPFISCRIHGYKQLSKKSEDIIYEIAQTSGPTKGIEEEAACPICLCAVEDSYRLEGCTLEFCRSCLVEQCDSALESGNGQFPNVPCPRGFWGPYITR